MLVGSFDQDGAGSGVLDSRNEGVLFLSQDVLLNEVSIAQVCFGEFFDRVDCGSPAGEDDPLHIPLFGSSEGHDACVGEDLKANGVDPLFVYDHKALVIAFADFVLQLNYLLAPLIGESSLAFGHFVPVASVGEEELGVDLGLFVFERNVAGEDVAVFKALWHIRVSGPMVEDQPLDQLSVAGQPVDHVHDLDHVQVDGLIGDPDDINCVHHDIHQLVG